MSKRFIEAIIEDYKYGSSSDDDNVKEFLSNFGELVVETDDDGDKHYKLKFFNEGSYDDGITVIQDWVEDTMDMSLEVCNELLKMYLIEEIKYDREFLKEIEEELQDLARGLEIEDEDEEEDPIEYEEEQKENKKPVEEVSSETESDASVEELVVF